MIPQVRLMIGQMKIEMVIKEDGTFTADGNAGTDSISSSGTWTFENDKITFKTTRENGEDLK
jgi:hypothetical protein